MSSKLEHTTRAIVSLGKEKKEIIRKNIKMAIVATLILSISGGYYFFTKKNNITKKPQREEVMKDLPSITEEDLDLMQEIFPARRQISDVNPAIQDLVKRGVIFKINSVSDIPNYFVDMKVEHYDKFVFHDVSHTKVHPDFADILVSISKKFNDNLKELGYTGGYVKITFTSLTRPSKNNKKSNASKNSAHQYGIASDNRIVGDRFQTDDDKPNNQKQEDVFMFVFAKVLDEFQSNGTIVVMTEKNPPHFHINMGVGKTKEPSSILGELDEKINHTQ